MSEKHEIINSAPNGEMPDSAWEDSLASQFSAGLYKFAKQRGWPSLQATPAEISETIIAQAEERADKLLDHQFLKIVSMALSIQFMTTTIQDLICECAAVCESPIEMAMCFALAIVGREGSRGVTFTFSDSYLGDAESSLQFVIEPQAQIGNYRVDFLITAKLIETEPEIQVYRKQVAVECDGFSFHDRTKEQASRDRSRDRDLQSQGFSVYRYAGTEIWANVFNCAQEVMNFMVDAVEGQRKAAELRRKQPKGEHDIKSAKSAG
jgi:very-short-patch-repair endonuclease